MLYDFLSKCKCALTEEMDDFQDALNKFVSLSPYVGFMPAITESLYPVFALSCTSAKQIVSPDVFIVPAGAHDYWAKPGFEESINKFYQDDEVREEYDTELEEIILLNSPDLNCAFTLYDGTQYNAIYCHITMPNGLARYLLVVLEAPEDCWKKIIEPYEIKCGIVIDSLKGMGDWFDHIPLYTVMRETKMTGLLPRYYFRGLYISHKPPRGFKKIYQIADDIYHNGHIVDDWQKELYEIDWDENQKDIV